MSLNLGILASSKAASAPAALLLDTYTGATIAYSLRKLRTAYTGAAIRVRRSSDNTETDIGFNGSGGLDTTALATFVGSNNGFVTTWYDQTANNKNLTQSTTANQPSIVISGVINLLNTKPVLTFDGTNDSMANSAVSGTYSALSLFEVIKINDTSQFVVNVINGQYTIAGSSGGGGGADSITILSRYKNGTITSTSTQGQVWTTFNTNSQLLLTEFSSNTGNHSNFGISNFGGGWEVNGQYQEVVLFPSNKSTDRIGIETNINSYYSIY